MTKNRDKKIYLADLSNEFTFSEKFNKNGISFNRVAFVFFLFIFISLIFSLKIFYYSSLPDGQLTQKKTIQKNNIRSDIIDNNGNYLAKTVLTNNVGINPNQENDKKKIFIKLKLLFPDLNSEKFNNKFKKKKFFYIKKKLSPEKYDQVRLLGEKSIITEQKITRIYPHQNLFSHVLGQIDDENNGVSGLEKSLDSDLKNSKKKVQLTLDTNIQFLIRNELVKFEKIFTSQGSAALLMNINSGEILSLVSLPDFNINKRNEIVDLKFINRITKGVYELGSIFKTFTLAGALNEKIVKRNTNFENLPKSIKCAGRKISEYDMEIPSTLTAEQILIRSGNIGSVRIAQLVGPEKHKSFLKKIGVLSSIDFDIDEVAPQKDYNFGKCKLATASFGHGVATTLLQLAKGYAVISNGGYDIKPSLIDKTSENKKKKTRLINKGVSDQVVAALRKIVNTEEGTAKFADVLNYEIGGKTGTADQPKEGSYSEAKINTFASIFPTSNPQYVFVVMLDTPQKAKDYYYKYRHQKGGWKGTLYNTAGWTSVEVVGKIMDKIGPILATKYLEIN